jgi:hypothetical protein
MRPATRKRANSGCFERFSAFFAGTLQGVPGAAAIRLHTIALSP